MTRDEEILQIKKNNKTIISMFAGLCVGIPLTVFSMHFHSQLHLSIEFCALFSWMVGMLTFWFFFLKTINDNRSVLRIVMQPKMQFFVISVACIIPLCLFGLAHEWSAGLIYSVVIGVPVVFRAIVWMYCRIRASSK